MTIKVKVVSRFVSHVLPLPQPQLQHFTGGSTRWVDCVLYCVLCIVGQKWKVLVKSTHHVVLSCVWLVDVLSGLTEKEGAKF